MSSHCVASSAELSPLLQPVIDPVSGGMEDTYEYVINRARKHVYGPCVGFLRKGYSEE